MMETHFTTEATVGDGALSRRALLIGLAGSSAATFAVAPDASAALPGVNATSGTHENPEIFKAYDHLLTAQSEVNKASAALDWLADEWRHAWPLAPVGILGFPNAHESRSLLLQATNAECDIIGHPILREVAGIPHMSRKFRQSTDRTCFTVETSEALRKRLDFWKQNKPRGRTEKALARNHAYRATKIEETERKLELALQYESETTAVRGKSGVAVVQRQLAEAEAHVRQLVSVVLAISIKTPEGLSLKAQALRIVAPSMFTLVDDGAFGSIAQILRDTVAVGEVRHEREGV
jgi:hypothetical protein